MRTYTVSEIFPTGIKIYGAYEGTSPRDALNRRCELVQYGIYGKFIVSWVNEQTHMIYSESFTVLRTPPIPPPEPFTITSGFRNL